MGIDTIIGTRRLTGHELLPNASEAVRVVIEYSSSATLPEVEFTVEFGTIGMIYTSLEEGDPGTKIVEVGATPEKCFISTTPGEINDYLVDDPDCGVDVVIPRNLSLPLSRVTSQTFNKTKCLNFDVPTFDSNYCNNYTDGQDVTSLLEELTLDESNSLYTYAIVEKSMVYSFIDFEYTIQDQTKTKVSKIGVLSFPFKDIESVVIQDNIQNIYAGAFTGNKLEDLEVPASVSKISVAAFYLNEISNLTLNDGLTDIGESAFSLNYLDEISLPSTLDS